MGFGFLVLGLGFGGLGVRFLALGLGVWSFGFQISGIGFRVQGLGFTAPSCPSTRGRTPQASWSRVRVRVKGWRFRFWVLGARVSGVGFG